MKNDVIWRVAFLGILGVLGAMAITKLAPRANTEGLLIRGRTKLTTRNQKK